MAVAKAEATSTGGCGFVGLLTLIFIVLKLTGFIHWSWWWVLAPSWICLLFVLLCVLVILYLAYARVAAKAFRRK